MIERIYNSTGYPYLTRYILFKSSYFNMYIHKFLSSDEDRALHDHPWNSFGLILWGSYMEHVPLDYEKWKKGDRTEKIIKRNFLNFVYRPAETIHRIELIDNKPVWTLFITTGKWREWGFWCPKGFTHNKVFLNDVGNKIGKGCDD